jgi:hypothetical protein
MEDNVSQNYLTPLEEAQVNAYCLTSNQFYIFLQLHMHCMIFSHAQQCRNVVDYGGDFLNNFPVPFYFYNNKKKNVILKLFVVKTNESW